MKSHHSRKGFIAYQTKVIMDLIYTGKLHLARIMIDDLREQYFHDDILRQDISKLYILEHEFEKALDLIEDINEDYTFKTLAMLYMKLNREDELYDLYYKYYKNIPKNKKLIYQNDDHHHRSYYYMRVLLKKRFNDLDDIDFDTLNYPGMQAFNYNRELTLQHILENHSGENENKSSFNKGIDIEALLNKTQEFIYEHPEKSYINTNITETFYFQYPNCGLSENNTLYDAFRVVCYVDSLNILTMYPCKLYNNATTCKFETSTSNNKIKIKSGLERFKDKYNI